MPRGRRSQPRRGSPVSTPHVDLNTLTVYELRARCHDAGLPETGRKAALVARLSNAKQPPRGTVNQETPPGQHQGAESDPPLATDGSLARAIERILDRRLQAYGQTTQTLNPLWPSSQDPSCQRSAQSGTTPPQPSTSSGSAPSSFTTLPPGPNGWPPADTRQPAITIPDGQSSAVPPVPPRLRDRVVRGEYFDFSELLPSSLSHQHEQCAITLPLGDGHTNSVQLAVTTQRPARRAVCDFSAWLEAWTVYSSIMTQHHPDRVSELIGYQHLILDAHQQFKTESVLNYDSAFRSYMAENPHARWDQVNTTLWSTKMLQGVRPSCPQCTKTHSRDRCTMHRTSNPQPFRTSTAPQAGRDEVCLNFNRGRPCFFQPCRLRHSCRTCGEQGHGAYQCRKKGPHSVTPSTRQPQQ